MSIKWKFREDILNHYINGVSGHTFKDAERRLNSLEVEAKEAFINGYCDGHGQAIENVRYNIIEYLKENGSIFVDKVNEICDVCAEVDYDYLNQ